MQYLTKRRLLIAGAVVLIAIAAVKLPGLGSEQGPTWAEAMIDDLVITVDIEGTLVSTDSSMLTPPRTARRIFDFKISMMAPEGEEVSAGTPILAFDTSDLQRRLRDRQTRAAQAAKNLEKLDRDLEQKRLQSELRLAEAEARVRRAELQVDVPEDLRSARELEKARLDLQLAKIEVRSLVAQIEAADDAGAAQRSVLEGNRTRAERNVAEIEQTIEQMTVLAPRSGTVIYVSNRQGTKKKVGDSAWRNDEIIELPDLNSLIGRGEVDEANAGRVAEGQPFRIRLDAHPDVEFTGTTASISRAVQRKSFSRNPLKAVRLELHFDETDVQRMRPGMRFRGTIETERITGTLMIPSHAVFPSPDGPVVYRRTLLGHEDVAVTLGRRNATMVEVLEGLDAGDVVAETHPGGR
ncbi:MAG: HlyD family efflux transporter periplasmic adaptor subunit [Acidobacteria bacterium]|nr:HlyD family efflux transporter periplasmic adaptor subunit [Acidobacteriota bacterium]